MLLCGDCLLCFSTSDIICINFAQVVEPSIVNTIIDTMQKPAQKTTRKLPNTPEVSEIDYKTRQQTSEKLYNTIEKDHHKTY